MSLTTFSDMERAVVLSAKMSIMKNVLNYLKSKILEHHYNSMFLSGGAIASLIQGGEPKDYDVYFKTIESQNFVLETLKTLHNDDIAVYDEKYRDVENHPSGKLITENAMTLTNKIQLIIKHTGTPESVRSTFDFEHCKPYYDFETDKLYISKEQYDLCFNRILKQNSKRIDKVSEWRIQKFENRGYTWQKFPSALQPTS